MGNPLSTVRPVTLAYLITWRTYGTYLHGDPESVDPRTNTYGEPRRDSSVDLNNWERAQMRSAPFILTSAMRRVVHDSIERTAAIKSWVLLGSNVRTNHVHIVLATEESPDRAMTSLKAWATRALRDSNLVSERAHPWSRHGSTRHLHTDRAIAHAIHYVNDLQDVPRRLDDCAAATRRSDPDCHSQQHAPSQSRL